MTKNNGAFPLIHKNWRYQIVYAKTNLNIYTNPFLCIYVISEITVKLIKKLWCYQYLNLEKVFQMLVLTNQYF